MTSKKYKDHKRRKYARSKKLARFLVPLTNVKSLDDPRGMLCTYSNGEVYRRVFYFRGYVKDCFGPTDDGFQMYWKLRLDPIWALCKAIARLGGWRASPATEYVDSNPGEYVVIDGEPVWLSRTT